MQLSLFEGPVETIIQDIRTEKQLNNQISYDVGTKIGGSWKDLARIRKSFLSTPSISDLTSIEDQDVAIAADIVTKDTFFGWFNLENCRDRGVEPNAAKAIQLLIHRILKAPADTKEDRRKYTEACIFVANLMKNVKSLEEFKNIDFTLNRYVYYESFSKENALQGIKSTEEAIQYETDSVVIATLRERIEEKKKKYQYIEKANQLRLSSLGRSFKNFFRDKSSRTGAYKKIYAVRSWEDLIKTSSKSETREKRTPVWERHLPERPDRHGGLVIQMEKPEEFISMFGFKGVEFGHWMEDDKGREHLFRAAEALTDLADIIDVPVTSLSLNKELSFSFGSRGSGRAWAHFEGKKRVINLTKTRGSLGVLAHEFFHAIDNHIYRYSHSFNNGKIGYATQGEIGNIVSGDISRAFLALMDAIKEGESQAVIDVSKRKGSYKIYSSFIKRYNQVEGNLQEFMDDTMADFDSTIQKTMSMYIHSSQQQLLAVKEKYERKRKTKLRTTAEALAQLHEELTGETVSLIPYTTNRSQYFQKAIEFDNNKVDKYFSKDVELAARAFEAYIYDELMKRNWVSDYLVCGVEDSLYPQGEERIKINQAIHTLIDCIRTIL